jgi:hypothetical protein
MHAPSGIIHVWERFSSFPTETLTKAWWYQQCAGSPRQRPVQLMKEHRAEYGCSGNCFDVAIWLQEEFRSAGIETEIIGRNLCSTKAHIAVIAFGERGNGYFCDLGDQWLQPILINKQALEFSPEYHSGFAPGTRVKVETAGDQLLFVHAHPDGKESIEQFLLAPVPNDILMRAADHSQALLRRPFVEIRAVHRPSETRQLWEYDRNECFWHLDSGLLTERDCDSPSSRSERIHQMTGISMHIISTAFEVYAQRGIEM